MESFEDALAALIAEWRNRGTPSDEIAQALEVERLLIQVENAKVEK